MRATNDHLGQKRVIISVFKDQKTTKNIRKNDGTYAQLFVGFPEWSFNGWDGATLGRALSDSGEIKAGDYLLTSYQAYRNDALEMDTVQLKKMGIEINDNEQAFCVPYSMCWFKIEEGELFPLGSNMVCSRLYLPGQFTEEDRAFMDSFRGKISSSTDDFANVRLAMEKKEKYLCYVRVDKMPAFPERYFVTESQREGRLIGDVIRMDCIKEGDIIVVKKLSDIELAYKWDNEYRTVIRVNFERDFAGAIVTGLEYQL